MADDERTRIKKAKMGMTEEQVGAISRRPREFSSSLHPRLPQCTANNVFSGPAPPPVPL